MVMNANDYCSSDEECADEMKCERGRCKGYPLGHKCTPPVYPGVRPLNFGLTHYVCGEGLVCAPENVKEKKYHCVYGGNLTQDCNETQPCKDTYVCNDGKCIKPFSLDEGAICDVCFNHFFHTLFGTYL